MDEATREMRAERKSVEAYGRHINRLRSKIGPPTQSEDAQLAHYRGERESSNKVATSRKAAEDYVK